MIVTHPNNKRFLDSLPKAEAGGFGDCLYGEQVVFDRHMQERRTHQKWHPPLDRFVEYGPEDESWCRFFGMGSLETIDDGPAFYIFHVPDPFSFLRIRPVSMIKNLA